MPATDLIDRPIGVGIIGLSATGGWAAGAHVPALRAVAGVELRAASASTAETARAAAAAHDVPVACRDAAELVERDDVDLVVITVKVPEHATLVRAAIDAGKSVLCEWPLGNGADEAEALAAEAEQRGVRSFVGLQARSSPTLRHVRDIIDSGVIGPVVSTSLLASGGSWGTTTHRRGHYLLDQANGATMLTIPFGHAVDAVDATLGQFAALNATTATRIPQVIDTDTGKLVTKSVADQVAVTGELANGTVITMHYRGGTCSGTNLLWEIDGTDGAIVITADQGHVQMGTLDVKIGRGAGASLDLLDDVPARLRATPLQPDSLATNVAEAYAQIARDLREGTRVVPDFRHAARQQRFLAAIEEAAASGQRAFYPRPVQGRG